MSMDRNPAGRGSMLAEAARRHEAALRAAGLASGAVDRYEDALRRMAEEGAAISPVAQVLLRDAQREVQEFQAAIRKEYPGNAAFHCIFAADQPIPRDPRDLLALARRVAREAPEYAQNLIKYAINAATVKHLRFLCEQLDRELGATDAAREARAAEEEITGAARNAFEGKPELRQFESP